MSLAITGSTQIAAVIGWPVAHSRSPQLLNAAFAASGIDAAMIPIGVPPERFTAAVAGLRAMRALGASVTSPHKLTALALCDELSSAAREIGAVNCLQLAGDELIGHNTDCEGFSAALRASGCTPNHVVLLGAGGAARAVAYGLASPEIVARRPAAWTTVTPWDRLGDAFARADLVVDCTPMALGDDEAAEVDRLPLDRLKPGAWVASLIYHRKPGLLARAAGRGHRILDGRGMLVHQGARAFEIWTGRPAPIAAMTQALSASLP